MKTLVILLSCTLFLAACESTTTSSTDKTSDIKVSGYTQVGGSVSPR